VIIHTARQLASSSRTQLVSFPGKIGATHHSVSEFEYRDRFQHLHIFVVELNVKGLVTVEDDEVVFEEFLVEGLFPIDAVCSEGIANELKDGFGVFGLVVVRPFHSMEFASPETHESLSLVKKRVVGGPSMI